MAGFPPASGAAAPGTVINPAWFNVALHATGGNGTTASPYTGWDSAVSAAMADGQTFFFLGVFQAAANINCDNHSNVTLLGANGHLPQSTYDTPVIGAPYSQIVWSINGPNVSAQNTAGFTMEGLALKNTNPGGVLTTAFVACGGGNATNVSTGVTLRDCLYDLSTGGSGSPICCVQLDGTVEAFLDNCTFYGAQYGVEGINAFSYSTAIHIRGGRFESQTQAPIHNPHDQWLLDHVVFEPGTASDGKWVVSSAGGSGAAVVGLTFIGCRQWDNGGGGNVLQMNIATYGLTMISCYTNSVGGVIVSPANGVTIHGLTLLGNSFQNNSSGGGNGQLFPTGGTAAVTAACIAANQYGTGMDNIAQYVTGGNIKDGSVVDSAGNSYLLNGTLNFAGARTSQGSGAPVTPGGVNPTAGDYYLRTDTPSTANQRLYVCTVGGAAPTWVGIV